MSDLLQTLFGQLRDNFSGDDAKQLHANLSILSGQLQQLVTRINENPLVHGVLPDIGIPQKIKEIEWLSREATQIFRNLEADALARSCLDKEIRRRKRVLRKLKRGTEHMFSASKTSADDDDEAVRPKSSKLSFRLPAIRDSIPLPAPSVNYRFNFGSSSKSSSIDTDDPLEFDLVWVSACAWANWFVCWCVIEWNGL